MLKTKVTRPNKVASTTTMFQEPLGRAANNDLVQSGGVRRVPVHRGDYRAGEALKNEGAHTAAGAQNQWRHRILRHV